MAAIERTSSGTWRGDLKTGAGTINATSGVLRDTPFTYATRFENAKGTNPEELIAAAHAACFSMAFANYLSTQGHRPLIDQHESHGLARERRDRQDAPRDRRSGAGHEGRVVQAVRSRGREEVPRVESAA